MPKTDLARFGSVIADAISRQSDRPAQAIAWAPNLGQQEKAFHSEADELFYGGAAGAGKTDLLLGLAFKQHRESVVFRREYPQLKAMIRRSKSIVGRSGRYNNTEKVWTLGDRHFEFGACQYEDDVEKWQGRPHDFIGFDEITHFTEYMYRFLIGWNRSTVEGQRCRVVATGNPPTTKEGRWVIRYWAPWLDPEYSSRTGKPMAEPGEFRWFVTIGGESREVDSPQPVYAEGEEIPIQPRSRTFIPGRLADNPHLKDTGYYAVLQGMPEPLRSQLLYGDFSIQPEDDRWQIIPSAWVRLAQSRWRTTPPTVQTHMGVDVARGGKDNTVIALRHKSWVAPLVIVPGDRTPDGDTVADLVISHRLSTKTSIRIDVIGVGASPYDCLKRLGVKPLIPIGSGEKATKPDTTGVLHFKNQRAQMWWHFRELLDPANGHNIALPDDSELELELTVPRWKRGSNDEIQVESKEDLAKADRLGRSPDRADAVIYAFAEVGIQTSDFSKW